MHKGFKGLGTFAVALTCACALGGCKSSSSGAQSAASGASADTQQSATQVEQAPASNSEYAVTIDSAEFAQDYSGAPCVVVTYTFTNVSHDEPQSMMIATNASVYQDGVECTSAIVADVDSQKLMSKVKAGSSVQVQQAYKLANETSDIEVEVKELFSWDDTILAQRTFKIGEGA